MSGFSRVTEKELPEHVSVPEDLTAAMILCDVVPIVETRWSQGEFRTSPIAAPPGSPRYVEEMRFCLVGATRAAIAHRLGLDDGHLLALNLSIPLADDIGIDNPGRMSPNDHVRLLAIEVDAIRTLAEQVVDMPAARRVLDFDPEGSTASEELDYYADVVIDYNDTYWVKEEDAIKVAKAACSAVEVPA